MNTNDEQPAVPPDRKCTDCGGQIVRIAYGYPTHEAWEAAERGEIALGGCMIFDDQPTDQCSACGKAFGSRLLERRRFDRDRP